MPSSTDDLRRRLTSAVSAEVRSPAEIVYSVAVGRQHEPLEESLSVTVDGEPTDVTEVVDAWGSRFHVVRAEPGALRVEYAALVGSAQPVESTELARVEFFRPSRYAESDRLFPVAGAVFADVEGPELLDAVGTWVHDQTRYVSGSSRVTDGAVDTYLSRRGVCRDFAHLVIAFLRARNVPARLASVYAPGLAPMDFHAVAEAWVDGAWHVVDATRLAPREAMVRIATGRDAADTAFMTVQSGLVDFTDMQVLATVEGGDLPEEDPAALVRLA